MAAQDPDLSRNDRLLTGPRQRPHVGIQPSNTLFEKIDQEKRILFTRRETQAIDRLIVSLAARVNTPVKLSHVFRAMTSLLLHAEGEIDKRATLRR